ncbi:MAG: hypothetical protein V1860_01290 [bacterium]
MSAELAILPIKGEEKVIKILKEFGDDYISKHEEYKNKLLYPIFIRFRIYQHLNIISVEQDLSFLMPKNIVPILFIKNIERENKRK